MNLVDEIRQAIVPDEGEAKMWVKCVSTTGKPIAFGSWAGVRGAGGSGRDRESEFRTFPLGSSGRERGGGDGGLR